MKHIIALILIATMPVVAMMIGNCGGDKTPNVYTFPNTHPLTVGVTYVFTHYGDTVAIEQAEIIDPNRGIIFTDEWKILIYNADRVNH